MVPNKSRKFGQPWKLKLECWGFRLPAKKGADATPLPPPLPLCADAGNPQTYRDRRALVTVSSQPSPATNPGGPRPLR